MTEQSTIPGLFCFFIAFVSLGARRVELDCAGPPHCVSPLLFREPMPSPPTLPAGLSLFPVSVSFPCCFPCFFSLSRSLVSFLCLCLFSLFLFPLPDIKRNFVPRKRFKWYNRGLKSCFVRGKRFRRNKTMSGVDEIVIVSRA